jgi:hypothetical protein
LKPVVGAFSPTVSPPFSGSFAFTARSQEMNSPQVFGVFSGSRPAAVTMLLFA